MEKINVAFRKFEDGDIIAVFLDNNYKKESGGFYLSYMHNGQHGDCSPKLIEELEIATEAEYAPLKKELESLGYVINII